MKKAIVIMSFAISGAIYAGTCTYSFGWFKNAAVTDFNVPLILQEGRNGFTYAGFADADGGTDLRIADTDSTLLPYEIENWNPQGTSIVWVKVPSFSSATTLTLTWGDADAAAADSVSAFWPNALAVMHFGDTPSKNSANGDSLNVAGSGTVQSEPSSLGKAAAFDRTAYYSNSSVEKSKYGAESITAFTVSFWLKTEHSSQASDATYLASWGQNAGNGVASTQCAVLLNWSGNANIRLYWARSYSGTWGVSDTAMTYPTDGRWHHIAFTYNGSTLTYYLDGKVNYTKDFSGFAINPWANDSGYFRVGSNGEYAYYGALDELRVEKACRSAAEVRAAAETQSFALPGHSVVIPFTDYEGAQPITDFPAYIQLDENVGINPGAFHAALQNGTATVTDYRTGALLPVEVECAYSNVFDCCLGVWVKMPRYSRADGVVLTMPESCYVPPEATYSGNTLGAAGVWNADDYRFVFHMNPNAAALKDVVNNVTLNPKYSASLSSSLATYAGTSAPIPVQGPTGPYQAYRSVSNAVQRCDALSVSATLTNVWTISWWMRESEAEAANPKSTTVVMSMINSNASLVHSILKGAGYSSYGAGPHMMVLNGCKECQLEIPDGGWHHYAYACDGSHTYCYRDGVLQTTSSQVRNFNFTSQITNYIVLMGANDAANLALLGDADEVRVEAVCRSADWIRACWRSQLAWRNGTPWQLAPHFAADVPCEVSAAGVLTASAELVCRTNATVTLFWGSKDAGETTKWDHSQNLGFHAEGAVSGTIQLPFDSARYVYRFCAENEFGTAWTAAQYATAPTRGKSFWSSDVKIDYDGAETLTNFPLCVRIPAMNDLPESPNRLRFLDEEGNTLSWEPEVWNPASTSVVWVVVPRLTSASALTIRFRNNFPDDGSWATSSVWSADEYVGVWHFASSSVSGDVTDDSSVFNARIRTNTLHSYATNGVAGTAFHWPRTTSSGGTLQNDTTPFFDFRNGFTFSLWMKIPDGNDSGQVFVKEELSERVGLASGMYMQMHIRYNKSAAGEVDLFPYIFDNRLVSSLSSGVRVYGETGTAISGNVTDAFKGVYSLSRPDDGWHHYAFVHDGAMMASYRDGSLMHRAYWPFVLNEGLKGNVKGKTAFGSDGQNSTISLGTLDEYRAERVGRSAAWIKACYDNQRPGSTFVTVGGFFRLGMVITFR